MLSDSFEKLEVTVTGRKSATGFAEGADVKGALDALRKIFGIREREIPARLKGLEEQLDYLLGASDIMYRKVKLESGWHKDAMGAMLTTLRESGAVVTVTRNTHVGDHRTVAGGTDYGITYETAHDDYVVKHFDFLQNIIFLIWPCRAGMGYFYPATHGAVR